jgi:hypothetical protein
VINIYAFVWSLTDVVIIGLAPEVPEDLYMLIKKVRLYGISDGSVLTINSRVLLSESISRETEKTRIPSSVSFSLNPEFTVSPATTRPSVSCHLPGSTRVLPQAPWSHRVVIQGMEENGVTITLYVALACVHT